jgi:mono/diheme cytochrome c family protein
MSERQPSQRRNGWGPFVTGVVAGVAVIALLVSAFAVGYNLGETRAKEAALEDTGAASEPTGTETGGDAEATALFAQTCGSCHTLAAAGTDGSAGPDLDALRPSRDQVLAAITNGGTGTVAMPGGL